MDFLKALKWLSFERGFLIPHRVGRGIDLSAGERLAHAVGIGGGAVVLVIADSGWRRSLISALHFAVAVGHFIGAAGEGKGEDRYDRGGKE